MPLSIINGAGNLELLSFELNKNTADVMWASEVNRKEKTLFLGNTQRVPERTWEVVVGAHVLPSVVHAESTKDEVTQSTKTAYLFEDVSLLETTEI